jgi:hypothetical protein
MSKLIGEKVVVISGQVAVVKVYAAARRSTTILTKPRFQRINKGSVWMARDNGQINTEVKHA